MKGLPHSKMPTVEKRHLIRKRSQERSEIKIVEKSKLYREAIQEVMSNRAEIIRCYKVIRELQSALTIYQETFKNRVMNDEKDITASPREIEIRSEEPALTPAEE